MSPASAPLSILHVALSGGFGGSERYAVDLAARQAAQGHRVGIVGRPGAQGLFAHVPPGVAAYAASRFFPSRAIARAIREQDAQVLNLHLPDSARAVRAIRSRPPAVMTLHLRYKAREFSGLDGMIRIADWQARETADFTGPSITAHNWQPALAPTDADAVAAARIALGAGPGTFVAGFLARLHRIKRADLLIAAWRRAALPGSILILVGDGPERAGLEAMAKGDTGIRFLGHRTDMGVWHRALDLFVLPSDWEGLPLGVLEAMGLGTPILATDCPGTAEALAESRARLVPCGDEVALAAALADARAQFAQGKLVRAPYDLSRFDPEIALSRIENFYRKLIADRS